MRNIFSVFKADITSLVKNFFALVVVIALTLLPSLYAWLNIYSNWDPYGSTKNISIAVVSLDKGCKLDDGTKANKGQDVIDDLRESTAINWVILDSSEDAIEGTKSGKYYAAVVIEKDFSYKMFHMLTQWDGQPSLTYYQNYKKNAVATKITDTAVESLHNSISKNYLEILVSKVFQQANILADDWKNDDPEDAIHGIIGQSRELLHACDRTMDAFAVASASADKIAIDPAELSKLLERADSALEDAKQKQQTLAGFELQVFQALDRIETQLSQASDALNDESALETLKELTDKAAQASGSLGDELSAWGQQFDPYDSDVMLTYIGIVNQAAEGIIATPENTADILADMNAKIAALQLPSTEVVAGAQARTVALALSQMCYSMQSQLSQVTELPDMPVVIGNCVAIVHAVEHLTSSWLVPTTEDLHNTISSVISDTSVTLSALQGTAQDADMLLDALKQTGDAADTLQERLRPVMQQVNNDLDNLLLKLDTSNEEEKLALVEKILGGDPKMYGEYFSQVVQTDVQSVYPIANYGSAMAPFYTVLAIWVGGVILVAIIKAHARTEGLTDPKPRQLFFGRYLLFFLLSQLQTAIIITGDLYLLKIQCLHPGLLYLTGALTSLTFSLLIYALTVSFGDVGKAIVVVIMVLQIAGSSGTFPIELLPDFYRKIYYLFPFPHAINAMRECICGLYGNDFIIYLLRLLIFAVIALLIGLLIRRPFIGLNRFVEEKLEETELL